MTLEENQKALIELRDVFLGYLQFSKPPYRELLGPLKTVLLFVVVGDAMLNMESLEVYLTRSGLMEGVKLTLDLYRN